MTVKDYAKLIAKEHRAHAVMIYSQTDKGDQLELVCHDSAGHVKAVEGLRKMADELEKSNRNCQQ